MNVTTGTSGLPTPGQFPPHLATPSVITGDRKGKKGSKSENSRRAELGRFPWMVWFNNLIL